jgi:formaldehyde-activating enzyme involved in methanogenesis
MKSIDLEYGSFKLQVEITFNPDSYSLSVIEVEPKGQNKKVLATFPQVSIEKSVEDVLLKGIIDGTRISSNVVHVSDKIHVFYNVRERKIPTEQSESCYDAAKNSLSLLFFAALNLANFRESRLFSNSHYLHLLLNL